MTLTRRSHRLAALAIVNRRRRSIAAHLGVFVVIASTLLGLCLSSSNAWADDAPRTLVRAHLEPAGNVIAGTDVKLVVDLLTTTFFTDAPDWPTFDVPRAVVSLPDEQATNLSETIDGVRWFGVSRAYRIAPQAAGAFDVPAFTITIHPGGIATPVEVKTPPLRFAATVPPGAEGMTTFFATPSLDAKQKIDPAPGSVHAGDVITRTVTQHANGTRSMLVPPAVFADVSGLRKTLNPPSTRDITQDRVGLVAGERIDSASYVAERAGKYTLPAITLEWWNATTHRRETVVLPSVTLSVSAAHEHTVFDIPADAMRGLNHRIIVIDTTHVAIGALIVALLFASVWAYPWLARASARLVRALRAWRRRFAQSDVAAWMALSTLARTHRMRDLIPLVYAWMDRYTDAHRPAQLKTFSKTQDTDVRTWVHAIETHYADIDADARVPTLDQRARRRVAHDRHGTGHADPDAVLPPLNPF